MSEQQQLVVNNVATVNGEQEEEKIPTVVRKTFIKIAFTPEQEAYFDNIVKQVCMRATVIMNVLLRQRHPGVDVRGARGDVLGKVYGSSDHDLAELYDLIMARSNASKTIRGPMVLAKCTVGTTSVKPLEQLCKSLHDSGRFPLKLPTFKLNAGYDYAAFQMAVSALKSWHECNTSTVAAYAKETCKVEELEAAVPDDIRNALTAWLTRHGLFITKRVLDKFGRYGWEAWLHNYPLTELKAVCDDEDVWQKAFEWWAAKRHLANMRPTATISWPWPKPREIQFGSNYRPFKIVQQGRALIVEIDGHKIATLPTRYFRNLRVTHIKNTNYEFTYERGNKSPFSENVTAVLREISLFQRDNGYFIGLPLNVQTEPSTITVKEFLEYFYATTDEAKRPNVRVLGIDLGLTNPAACAVLEADAAGTRVLARVQAVEIGDQHYFDTFRRINDGIGRMYKKLDELAEKVKGIPPFTAEWLNIVRPIARKMKAFRKGFAKAARYDLKTSFCLGSEQLQFIRVHKRFMGLLKKWTYFGTKPADRKEYRPGFQTYTRRQRNVCLDFRKKVGCAIIRVARQYNCPIVVIENLEHFLPDDTQKSSMNEMLMLWGSGQIGRWIDHFAAQYGIVVIKLDPRLTSQTDPETGAVGYRSRWHRENLYVERDGVLYIINSDIAGAENLARRALERCLNEPFVQTVRVEGGYALWWKRPASQKEGYAEKLRRFRLTARFGTHLLMVNDEGQLVPLLTVPADGKKVYLTKFADGWWPDSVRYKRRDELAARAGEPVKEKPRKQAQVKKTKDLAPRAPKTAARKT